MFEGVLKPLSLRVDQCHKGILGRMFSKHAHIVHSRLTAEYLATSLAEIQQAFLT
jgi:hypothetical protein